MTYDAETGTSAAATEQNQQEQQQEGIAAGDMPAVLAVIDIVMKYTRHESKGDTMALQDLEKYVDALLKFSSFAFISLSRLIDYHMKTVAPDTTTTKTDDIREVMKRYSSIYS